MNTSSPARSAPLARRRSPLPFKRLALASAVALAATGPGLAHAADSPPTVPGNLTARLYPGSGGELFWSRSTDDRGVRGYEITRNGTSLGIRDATSFYDPSLKAGTAYAFTVAAIDSAGQRSAKASTSLGGAAAGPSPAAPQAAAPAPGGAAVAPPAGLRAEVYSATEAKLFWNRSPVAGTNYKIRRDGAPVGASNTTDFYDNRLSGGRRYTYTVIAFDRSGRASAPATISVRTPAAGTAAAPGGNPFGAAAPAPAGQPTAAPQPAAGGVPAPANASLRVYSPTTAELFWQRPAPSAGVVSTEVRRDGTVVQTGGGTSYYDANRVAGRTYRYELTAIGAGGRRSSVTVVGGASTPAASAPSAPSAGGLPAALRTRTANLFAAANGDALEKMAAIGKRLRKPRDFGASFVSTRNVNDAFRADLYRCPKGGTVEVQTGPVDTSGTVGVSELRASACAVGPITVSGRFLGGNPVDQGRGDGTAIDSASVNDYRLVDSRDGSVATMTLGDVRFDTGGRLGTSRVARTWDARGLAVSGGAGGTYAATRTSTGVDDVSAGGGYTFNADGLTGVAGTGARVQTTGNFRRSGGAGNYATGTLEVIAGAERYTIDADGGDANAFQLTATANGATNAYTVPWSDRYGFTRFDPASVNLGF